MKKLNIILYLFLLHILNSFANNNKIKNPPNGCHISLTLDEFMNKVATSMGKTSNDIASYTKKLKDNWITTPDALWDVTDSQWQSMQFPVGLVDNIKKLLSQLCCTLQCNHGGEPNSECTSCINCLGGWTGTKCDTWNPSQSKDTLIKQLRQIAQDSINYINEQKKLNPLPTNIGTGVDITTGQWRLPIIKLSYNNSRSWTNSKGKMFRLPSQATFDTIPTGIYNPETDTFVIETMGDYVNLIFSWANSKAVGGMFSHQKSLQDVFNTYFNGDFSLAIIQQYYPIYKLTLPIDPTTKTRNYELDRFAKRALDFLPPDYSSDINKALYQEFVANWGTSYTVESIDGGLLELMSFFQTRIITNGEFSKQELANQVQIDFDNVLGKPDGKTLAKGYEENRKLSTLDCMGGDAAEYCDPKKLQSQWIPSIEDSATSIEYSLADFTELISDQTKRSNIQQAIAAYIAEQEAAWKNMNTCPVCVWGTCHKPNQYCDCENSKITGRTCDKCISGWTGIKCTTPVCSQGCQHGTCVAPDNCQCSGHFTGSSCSQCTSGWSGSECNNPVCNPSCKNGGSCISPGTCHCVGRFTGPTCSDCVAGWHGTHCNEGQTCFECNGQGEICNSAGCQYGKFKCPGCGGTGIIPDNVQRCFRCNGHGTICSSPSNCNIQQTCPGCHSKGYIPGNAKKCPTCHGQGIVCTSSTCTMTATCRTCSGRGYIM